MQEPEESKSKFFLIAAATVAVLFVVAIAFVLKMDLKEDATITASYESLNKKLNVELPIPDELSADFQLNHEGNWTATGPVTDKELQKLVDKQQFLDSLNITGGEITPAGLSLLNDRHTKNLMLEFMVLDARHADALSKLGELTSINLRDKSINDEMITHLTGPAGLRIIHLHNTTITNRGVAHIVKTFPSLVDFEISGDKNIDDGVFALLKSAKSLVWLDVSCTSVSKEAVQSFLNKSKLRGLGIADLQIDDAYVTRLPANLVYLDLSFNPVTDAALESIATRMKGIKVLRLTNKTKITPAGLEKLQKRLPFCKIVARGQSTEGL